MCITCLSTAEAYAAQAALVVAVVKDPVRRVLAEAGLVAPADVVGRDARTVAFLRALDLDPVEVLGAEAVAAADRWVPQERTSLVARLRSARPIGSQRAMSTT
jgi:hypothetical protein